MKKARFIRGIVTAAATIAGYSTLQVGGYHDGIETTSGIDAGMARDLITTIIGLSVGFFPSAASLRGHWRQFTNQARVEELEKQLEKLKTTKSTSRRSTKS